MDYTSLNNECIIEAINQFYNRIKDKEPGSANTRFYSWEYCHKAFFNQKR